MSDDVSNTLAAILTDLEGVEPVAPPDPEWPDAKALCCHYGAAMRNLPAYRLGMAASGIVELAYEFAVMDQLVRLLEVSDEPVAKLACPAMARLRDICTAEGLRRGIVLAAGDDVSAISLAAELMEEMIAAYGFPLAQQGMG